MKDFVEVVELFGLDLKLVMFWSDVLYVYFGGFMVEVEELFKKFGYFS